MSIRLPSLSCTSTVAAIAPSTPNVPHTRRATSHTPTMAATFTVPTPSAVPQYGSSFVNGASRSSCNGPRLFSHTPSSREPFDHAPTSGLCRVSTSRDRTVK